MLFEARSRGKSCKTPQAQAFPSGNLDVLTPKFPLLASALCPGVTVSSKFDGPNLGSSIRVKGHTWMPSTGGFWCLQVKIHDDRLLAIPHDYGLALLIGISINFLVRHIRGNVNKISGSGFVPEFQSITPAHPHSSFHHVQDGFQLSMVVRPRLRIRLDDHGPSPQRGSSGFRMSNGGGPRHTRSLWCIHVQFVGMYDFDSVLPPVHM